MQVDDKITLKDGKTYGILLESEELDNYFLVVLLNDKEEPTNTYSVIEKVEKDGQLYIKRIENPLILNSLLEDFREQNEEN